MRILLNTKPLLYANRTGVGTYIHNLWPALAAAGVDVIPTHRESSANVMRTLSRASDGLRTLLGRHYPAPLRALVRKTGDIMYAGIYRETPGQVSRSGELYHETTLDPMPETTGPSVANLYDLSFLKYPELLEPDSPGPVTEGARRNTARAGRVIVNTESVRSEAIEGLRIPAGKIDVIPLAPAPHFRPLERTAPRPESVAMFTPRQYILYAGTVEPRKNLKTLISAFGTLRKRYDLALVIAGGWGWLYDDIVAMPEALGLAEDVVFTHYVDDQTLVHLYQHALVVVYPPLYEGFGLPPLEAMACGAPVIISDIPPLREVAGDGAISFPPLDREALAAKLEQVISSSDLRRWLCEKGLRRAREFSWRKTAELTIETYRRALSS